jgi:hypothetical protein
LIITADELAQAMHRKLDELQIVQADQITRGLPASYEDYKFAVGIIHAVKTMRDFVRTVQQRDGNLEGLISR